MLAYLQRGIAAGAAGGTAYGLYVAAVANPLVRYLEGVAGGGSAHGHGGGHVVSETTTAAISVGSGVLWGVFLGAAFGLAYYLLEPALPGAERVRPYVLAGAGFLTVSAVPWLALPPAVPGVEHALGADVRIAVYGAAMGLGALVAAASVFGYRRSRDRGRWLALAVAAAPLAAVAVSLPAATPAAAGGGEVPPALVAAFRSTVVLSAAALWTIIAGSFARLQARSDGTETEPFGDAAAVGTDAGAAGTAGRSGQ